MTRKRTKVGKKVLAQLKREAGDKCANPGCSTRGTHIHHIRQWSVYRTHDAKHMIAVCPTCHDQIHHGDLSITDETVYRWKELIRLGDAHRGHLYIEPSGINKVLTDSVAFMAPLNIAVFHMSDKNYLRFDVDENLLFLDLLMYTYKRGEVLRVKNNHLRLDINPSVEYKEVNGHIQVTVPATPDYIPPRVVERMIKEDPSFVIDGKVVVLSLEVIEAGLVKIQGVWSESDRAFVFTKNDFCVLQPTWGPLAIKTKDGGTATFFSTATSNNRRAAVFGFPL